MRVAIWSSNRYTSREIYRYCYYDFTNSIYSFLCSCGNFRNFNIFLDFPQPDLNHVPFFSRIPWFFSSLLLFSFTWFIRSYTAANNNKNNPGSWWKPTACEMHDQHLESYREQKCNNLKEMKKFVNEGVIHINMREEFSNHDETVLNVVFIRSVGNGKSNKSITNKCRMDWSQAWPEERKKNKDQRGGRVNQVRYTVMSFLFTWLRVEHDLSSENASGRQELDKSSRIGAVIPVASVTNCCGTEDMGTSPV